jgi:hypothetical protein
MALGSTQPLTEMSTRCISLLPFCAVAMKSRNLNFLEPFGPLQTCNGTAFTLEQFCKFTTFLAHQHENLSYTGCPRMKYIYIVVFLFNTVIYVFLLCLCILIVCLCIHRANWHSSATLTEGFPCFLLSCKANARV